MDYRDRAVEILKQNDDLMYEILDDFCPSFFGLDNKENTNSSECDFDCRQCWNRKYKEK